MVERIHERILADQVILGRLQVSVKKKKIMRRNIFTQSDKKNITCFIEKPYTEPKCIVGLPQKSVSMNSSGLNIRSSNW